LKNAATTVNCYLKFTTPIVPSDTVCHLVLLLSVTVDQNKHLRSAGFQCSLKADTSGGGLSTYVSLSVRSCIYNSESKIVLCLLC